MSNLVYMKRCCFFAPSFVSNWFCFQCAISLHFLSFSACLLGDCCCCCCFCAHSALAHNRTEIKTNRSNRSECVGARKIWTRSKEIAARRREDNRISLRSRYQNEMARNEKKRRRWRRRQRRRMQAQTRNEIAIICRDLNWRVCDRICRFS